MTSSIHERVRTFILENFLFTHDTSRLSLSDSLLGRGIVNSTGMLEIILFLEEEFGVVVEDREMLPANLDSVNQIAAFVQSKRAAA